MGKKKENAEPPAEQTFVLYGESYAERHRYHSKMTDDKYMDDISEFPPQEPKDHVFKIVYLKDYPERIKKLPQELQDWIQETGGKITITRT